MFTGIEKGGWGATAYFIGKNYFEQFKYREYLGEQVDFVDGFTADLVLITFEIRRLEHLWGKVYRELDKLITVKNTETHSVSGKTGKNEQGSREKQQIMTKDMVEKESKSGNSSTWDQEGINIVKKVVNIAPLGKIISAVSTLNIDFSKYYSRLGRWFQQYTSPSGIRVITDSTGRRKWVTEEEYEELVEEATEKEEAKTTKQKSKPLEGNEWDETLPYLERLKIRHSKNVKEHDSLPDSSNRKPRVKKRVDCGENFVKAFEKEIDLPNKQVFLDRINGKVEGFKKVVGYENVIKMVADYVDSWNFYKKFGGPEPAQLMIGLLGKPGLGKTYIAQAIGKSLGVGYHRVNLNGKKDASVIYGTNIENPGSEIGEILKGISNNQNQSTVIFFDEIEKAEKGAKDAIGDPTDRTGNESFKDALYDFSVPLNNVIYFCALNYSEELPDFVRDRFTMIEVTPPSYQQRIEILKTLLTSSIKAFDEPFQKIYGKGWEEVYYLFDEEELFKKALTKTFSIRGAKDNIENIITTLRVDFLIPNKNLPINPQEFIDYDWNFRQKEDLDIGDKRRGRIPCPHGEEKVKNGTSEKEHLDSCECFVNNLDKVEGWKENMEENNNSSKSKPSFFDPKLKRWKDISFHFTKELVQEWEDNAFTYKTTKEWIDIGMEVQDAPFCAWLRDIKKVNAEWVLNDGDIKELRDEYQ